MLALQYPLPAFQRNQNPQSLCKLKPSLLLAPSHSRTRNSTSNSTPFSSIFLPKARVLVSASESSVAEVEEVEEKGRLNDGDTVLPLGLRKDSIPRHVAIIMDGNSRWARARGLPTGSGHEAGVKALKEILKLSCKWGIRVLTVFAFSYENWLRGKPEVDFLMYLLESVLQTEVENLHREEIRLSVIGDTSKLPNSLQQLIKEAEVRTRNNMQLQLIVALSYSGRNDIVQACQKIAYRVKEGLLQPADITESVIEQELATNCAVDSPNPDLLIRTSGELRVSNFLLWQAAYSELFFSPSLWPDFGEDEYAEALLSFQHRKRRFGGRVSEE
ncbi:cis-prenyltransferase 4, chloroplastic-like [Tasmannia lanceolata]|uniref:cis-prenyltransferase 4, chloroplastic-like n=1 Tax=Tasmannia lanceolata TaxID=3420 RepID=UPI004063F4BC